MIGHVYRIEFPDGHFYIGSTTKSLKQRLQEHKSQKIKQDKWLLDNGWMPQTRFDMYIRKYGWNNPSIYAHTSCEVSNSSTSNSNELRKIEQSVIKANFSDPKCLNDKCQGKPLHHTEPQRLCALERLFNRPQEPWREFWIHKIIENWLLRPALYSFKEAMAEFENAGLKCSAV